MSKRTLIVGPPNSGKTTLALKTAAMETPDSRPVYHTDDVMHLDWSESSKAVSEWMDRPGPWIIEGCTVARALRKWINLHPRQPLPVDEIIYLRESHLPLTTEQNTMWRGMQSIMNAIMPKIRHLIREKS